MTVGKPRPFKGGDERKGYELRLFPRYSEKERKKEKSGCSQARATGEAEPVTTLNKIKLGLEKF